MIAIHDPTEIAVAVHELILVGVTVAERVWAEAVFDAGDLSAERDKG